MRAMRISPNQTTGDPSLYPTNPPGLTTLNCVLQALEYASQEERVTAVKIVDFPDKDESASKTSNGIHLPLLRNLNDVEGGFSHLSLTAQSSITAKFGIFPVIDDSRAEPLPIDGVGHKRAEVNFTPVCEIGAHPHYQSHDLGCSAAVEPWLPSSDDPAWLLSTAEDAIMWKPSLRKCQSQLVIQQPPTFFDNWSLSQIDDALISGVATDYHKAKKVLPGQRVGLFLSSPVMEFTSISEKIESVPKVQPYAYDPSLDQSGSYLDRAHMCLEFTPIFEEIESVPKVQLDDYNPSLDQSGSYLDRAHMRLEFTPIFEKIESVPKVQPDYYDPSLDQSEIYLDRAYMRLSAIRAQASSEQHRGSTTWYDTMLRSQQMSRTTHRGLDHYTVADCHSSPSSSNAAGSARRRHEHSWYATILRSKAAAAAHGRECRERQ